MSEVPTGTVTFLFTDIEGSTRLARSHAASWEGLRARHDLLLQAAVGAHGGRIFKRIGDAFCIAYATVADAVAAALAAQHALQAEPWSPAPVRVRMGLHMGEARATRDESGVLDYVGYVTLARAQQVMSAAHGEQVLMSTSCAQFVRDTPPGAWRVTDLGPHRLKGFDQPERLWQIDEPGLRTGFPALATSASTPNNLPRWTTHFIGRGTEIDQCLRLLEPGRLLTLTAIGGAGKTRLAVEVARAVLADYPDGVWFIDLAQVQESPRVALATASALGLREQPGVAILDTLVDSLAARRSLLMLDNCEHVLDAAGHLAQALLERCERVAILATSREGLGIPGEQVFTVRSLAMPQQSDPASIERSDAVALFLDRARLADPTLAIDASDAADAFEICRRLDGIALAIELAAARVKVLSLHDIRTRLGDRFRLLTGGNRALPRQQTLLAALTWSYDLLTSSEQRLLCRLAVFIGGWTLPAATAVAGDNADEFEVLDTLSRLADKSLITVDRTAMLESRYTMVETVRQYALERIEPGELDQARTRHARFFVRFAEDFGRLEGAGFHASIDRVDADHENLLAAHAACGLHDELGVPGLMLVAGLEDYWLHRGMPALAIRVMKEACERPGARAPSLERGKVLIGVALFSLVHGAYEEGLNACEEGLSLSRTLGNDALMCDFQQRRIALLNACGDLEQARARVEENLVVAQALGGRHLVRAWHYRAELLRRLGDYAEAERLYAGDLEYARASGRENSAATALLNLSFAATQRGETATLPHRLAECLSLKADALVQMSALQMCAVLAYSKGSLHLAARFHAVAELAATRAHIRPEPVDAMVYTPYIDRLREALGDEAFAAILAASSGEEFAEVSREARVWLESL
ncbi:MAG TPA: adenylate/guanylate cyclase domain-containing protein [Casimicrobiaceae bacterium]|nr:adenylate/guanylate cyclase domain-containing protein [Casimicrobiaceae bacterium]